MEIARLDVGGGPVLGILPAARYEQACCEVRPGDVLVLYSDGLIEATNPAGEEYGEGRLRDLLATADAGSPDDIRDAILASASAFAGAALRSETTSPWSSRGSRSGSRAAEPCEAHATH